MLLSGHLFIGSMGQQISPTPNTKENHLYAEDGDFNSELYQNYGKLWAKNIILDNSGKLINRWDCTLNNYNYGRLNNSGTLIFQAGSTFANTGCSKYINPTLTNSGTIES